MEFRCAYCDKKFAKKEKVIFCQCCKSVYCLECFRKLKKEQDKKKNNLIEKDKL